VTSAGAWWPATHGLLGYANAQAINICCGYGKRQQGRRQVLVDRGAARNGGLCQQKNNMTALNIYLIVLLKLFTKSV